MTYRAPRPAVAPMPLFDAAPALPRVAQSDPALFGTFVLEITTPDSLPTAPALAGWQLRVWPVARLGDATSGSQASRCTPGRCRPYSRPARTRLRYARPSSHP
ncbi:hypothetical protein [Deinococcus aquatilis]|uniref:hypothetical protein n=1 Tax=Deinococcus aquatilis TaxID=519440 RepID=UPI00036FDCD8|nr:hypothetical protein [Deinococcus aquatilis]